MKIACIFLLVRRKFVRDSREHPYVGFTMRRSTSGTSKARVTCSSQKTDYKSSLKAGFSI